MIFWETLAVGWIRGEVSCWNLQTPVNIPLRFSPSGNGVFLPLPNPPEAEKAPSGQTSTFSIYSVIFAIVLMTRIYTRKIVAAIFLLSLLFIHCAKFLHSHSYNNISSKQCTYGQALQTEFVTTSNSTTSADCTICNYQLPTPADDLFPADETYLPAIKINFNTAFHSHKSLIAFSSFETRGPPVFI